MAKPAADDAKKFLALVDLNKRSARLAEFKLAVYHPIVEEYEYQWGGKTRTSKNLNCLLVDESDKTSYCNAQFKLTRISQKQFDQAVKKFTNGARLILS